MIKHRLFVATALLLLVSAAAAAGDHKSPPYVSPQFYSFSQPSDGDFSDYRPVLSANADAVIFERTFSKDPNFTQLYIAELAPSSATPQPKLFIDNKKLVSTRPDWCWQRSSGKSPTTGPVAFSNSNGVYVVSGANVTLLPNTAGMVYPSWYPNCRHLAVDVGQNAQVDGEQLTAEIDATSGAVVAAPLANHKVWAGFPSVNQADPRLISFAGQFIGGSNYYNQDLNYTWVTNRSAHPPLVAPMDRKAPAGPGFLQQFQARAGWWSPDGKWFAFESNRACNDLSGATYAIFIQDSRGIGPAMQVTSCEWNANHPKWFPPGSTGGKTMLIAAIAEAASTAGQNAPYHIATLDVTAFVQRR